jgi:uncharacterized protein YdcH (DUF465 family)
VSFLHYFVVNFGTAEPLTTAEIYLSANYEIPLNRYQLLWYFLTEQEQTAGGLARMLTPRDQLLTGHDQFRRLVQEHSQYSQRLESLTQKRYLTDDEKLEEVRLKKLKLRLKDQMQSLEMQFQRQSA